MSIDYRQGFIAVVVLLICDICLVFVPVVCDAANSIAKGQTLKDGETLVSSELRFEMGFFGEENSMSRYVGIWYKDVTPPTYIWVANRDVPLTDTAGLMRIEEDGKLVILDGTNTSVWSSNVTTGSAANTTAILQDTGNLIVSNGAAAAAAANPYWQSFDHPGDTYLPSMKVSVNATMGENFCFNSWRSLTDPRPGNYVMGIDPRSAPQIVIWEQGNRRWRSGYWDGRTFTGIANMTGNYLYGFQLSNDGDDRYFTYSLWNKSDKFRFQITWDGYEKELRWNDTDNRWEEFQVAPSGDCDFYNKCGNFGICSDSGDPICSCLKGFEPVFMDQWKKGNWSGGCRRKTQLKSERNASSENGEDDGFFELKHAKLPDFAESVEVWQNNQELCEGVCLKDDACTASAAVDGIGCMIWHGDLHDIQLFDTSGKSISIRLAASDLDKGKIPVVVIIISVIAGLILIGVLVWLIWRFKFKLKVLPSASCCDGEVPVFQMIEGRETSKEFSASMGTSRDGDQEYGPELPLFNFNCVSLATDNFADANKLGQGGFGPVYKGILPGGQEIALKRLSRKSSQGSEEFKNEVILLAKVQHRNLVRLLGCCIQGEEKMLLYEYLPNKSLDCFIFDPAKKTILDWKKRFDIIEGIARGLLYLHRDSRLRIIHRDLKASNILLDEEMNPKISDFGMARIFGGNQNEANTNRVVGTYGYMSPEYAMEGLFSVKSDVYSFGVLLLEIVSGRKNTSFRLSENSSLIEYAWDLWTEGNAMELVDPVISDSCCTSEVLRCIHVAMLCVQDSATSRPSMASVVLMLESEATTLPLPRQPTSTSMGRSTEREIFLENQEAAGSNDLTITMLTGR